MNDADGDWMRSLLRAALTDAMKRRDADAARAYRSAISAIDNAEAVGMRDDDHAGAVESSPRGVGIADRPRRNVGAAEAVRIVRDEVTERREAAALIRGADPQRATALDEGADLLAALIEAHPEEPTQ